MNDNLTTVMEPQNIPLNKPINLLFTFDTLNKVHTYLPILLSDMTSGCQFHDIKMDSWIIIQDSVVWRYQGSVIITPPKSCTELTTQLYYEIFLIRNILKKHGILNAKISGISCLVNGQNNY